MLIIILNINTVEIISLNSHLSIMNYDEELFHFLNFSCPVCLLCLVMTLSLVLIMILIKVVDAKKKHPWLNYMTPILSVVLEGDRMVLKYDDHGNESGVELELVNALN